MGWLLELPGQRSDGEHCGTHTTNGQRAAGKSLVLNSISNSFAFWVSCDVPWAIILKQSRLISCPSWLENITMSNHRIKLSLGFCVQPEVHGDNQQGVYFIMPRQVNLS
jgi:hypothetical protein